MRLPYFLFLSPGEHIVIMLHPKPTGISRSWRSNFQDNPISPIIIKHIEFKILAFDEFIIIYLMIKVL